MRGAVLLGCGLCIGCSGSGGGAPVDPTKQEPALGVENATCEETLSDVLVFHPVCLDAQHRIVPWTDRQSPYVDIVDRAWTALEGVPNLPNGKPTYYSSALFTGTPPDPWAPGKGLAHHPAGVLSMFVDSALSYYAYSADEAPLTQVVLPFADHLLENGMTEPGDSWSSVPYSCSDFGSLTYHGSSAGNGSGDGYGYLEPDKVGEVGLALLRLYEHGGDERYLKVAIACADALVAHRADGDAQASPWPFRVDAATGADVIEPFGAQVAGPLRLFAELARIGKGNVKGYRAAHEAVLAWALREPFVSHDWQHYFEDVATTPLQNRNQYAPLELARYFLQTPDVTDDAVGKAKALIDWVAEVFGQDFTNDDGQGGTLFEPGMQYGAEAMSEQELDTAKMGSHTARFASLLALYYEKTGDTKSRGRAFRSFNWATYCESDDGLVNVGPNPREGFWFSDGYGDYIRHFMAGLGSVPEWAPPKENHLVRSSSIVQQIALSSKELTYSTFDATGDDVLRLARAPKSLSLEGRMAEQGEELNQYVVQPVESGGVVVRLRRADAYAVRVTF